MAFFLTIKFFHKRICETSFILTSSKRKFTHATDAKNEFKKKTPQIGTKKPLIRQMKMLQLDATAIAFEALCLHFL